MLFYSFFKTLVGRELSVELKNGTVLKGELVSIDQFLNIKLKTVGFKSVFIRGSVVYSVSLDKSLVDVELLQDACRKELSII
jgi:U6 snRNA-associated Sm-like protein LSm2